MAQRWTSKSGLMAILRQLLHTSGQWRRQKSVTPKHVVQATTSKQGGESEARATFLPHDRQQVANFQRSVAKPKDDDVLYSIMLECTLAKGKGEVFVQDVKAAPVCGV